MNCTPPVKAAKRHSAFSLVEVAIALGIAAVCSISVLALLAGGSRIASDSWQRTASVDAMVAVADSIRASTSGTDGMYRAKKPFDTIAKLKWRPGDGLISADLFFDKMCTNVPSAANADLALHVDLGAPADTHSPGTIYCSVAWPSGARWSAQGWTNCSGFVDMWVPFIISNP